MPQHRRKHPVNGWLVPASLALALTWAAPLQAATVKPPARAATAPVMAAVPAIPVVAADPQDVDSIDGIVAALYDIISGPPGKARDWSRLQAVFAPDGRLIYNRALSGYAGVGQSMTVPQYANLVTVPLQSQGFFEKEIARSTNRFGQIAQVFSTYEARGAATDAKPYERGINSVQLFYDGRRWWVTSLTWQAETPATPLPVHYLKSNY